VLDPAAAQRIHPNNLRRVVRALEVHYHTGRRITALQKKRTAALATVICLTLPQDVLDSRIDGRVREMFRLGFVEEVEALRKLGYTRDLPSMQSIGYPEVWALIAGETSLDEAVERIQRATRRLARRQVAWFRRDDPRIRWLDASGGPPERELMEAAERAERRRGS
jgi:tRNA dimethylallyltransferase